MTGPGKAAPPEGIARTGSISAVGREMVMRCKRASSNRRSGQITRALTSCLPVQSWRETPKLSHRSLTATGRWSIEPAIGTR